MAVAASKLIGNNGSLTNVASLNDQQVTCLQDRLPVLIAPGLSNEVRNIKFDAVAFDV
jgi:hypothetical protein